jgi:hypothetical protein
LQSFWTRGSLGGKRTEWRCGWFVDSTCFRVNIQS